MTLTRIPRKDLRVRGHKGHAQASKKVGQILANSRFALNAATDYGAYYKPKQSF